jgi:MYXO-CTERM domain-containing protein
MLRLMAAFFFGALVMTVGVANASVFNEGDLPLGGNIIELSPACSPCEVSSWAGFGVLSQSSDVALFELDRPASAAFPVTVTVTPNANDAPTAMQWAVATNFGFSNAVGSVFTSSTTASTSDIFTSMLVASFLYGVIFDNPNGLGVFTVSVAQSDASPTPLPGTLALFGSAMLAGGLLLRRRRSGSATA